MSMKKHIVFSVAGMTPGVITETLYGLLQQPEPACGGEIHILSTTKGRDGTPQREGLTLLLGESGTVAAFNRDYGTQWEIRPEWIEIIAGDSGELADLRTTADNEAAAHCIVARVREWTARKEVILHASVAGGRKTMGLFLAQAMSWFARPQDDLSHVLVAEQFEQNVIDFSYPKPGNPEHEGAVDFAPLPFVRMRGLLPPLLDGEHDYSARVRLSQIYLDDISGQGGRISLNLETRALSLDDYELAHLQPVSLGLYLFLCEHANLALGQEPFCFKAAFAWREELASCLERASLGLNPSKHASGLSALARGHRNDWPGWWQEMGDNDTEALRRADLNAGFTRLRRDFRDLWVNGNASFQVQGDSSKGNPSRWVEIARERLALEE
jgi:CRISPR-associated protein (TIGR02584 family)